jgi:serine/threonine protein kinase
VIARRRLPIRHGCPRRARFKRELLLAREVTHKNVVRIHDLGEIDGIKYITMSYVDGENLSAILRRRGKLPVRDALEVARQIASGLQAAHEAGVVHRDLKPANVMIDRTGRAIIMDFGIARLESTSRPTDTTVLAIPGPGPSADGLTGGTLAGAVVGTVDYMAPEQAKGGPVDHRADIYAFGLILRDMLVGLRPRRDARGSEGAHRKACLPSGRSIPVCLRHWSASRAGASRWIPRHVTRQRLSSAASSPVSTTTGKRCPSLGA